VTCSSESIPAGWQVFSGAVPAPLTQWAMAIRDRISKYAYGSIAETIQYNGQNYGAFKSHHSWTYRKNPSGTMTLVTGLCIPGISLLVPTSSGTGVVGAITPVPGPDVALAVYGADDVPRPTDWGLVAVGAIASAAIIGAFYLTLRTPRKG
jgi:hypothetical protein